MSRHQYDFEISYIYLLVALPIVLANIFILGPFQTADEDNHFLRIAQLSRGYIVGELDSQHSAGGKVDSTLGPTVRSFAHLHRRPDLKVSAEAVRAARKTFWSWPDVTHERFNNTAIYPPYFYAPAVLAVKVSQFLGTSLLDALTLTRLAQGLASIFVGYLALRFARCGKFTLFALLCLPMTLSLSGSASQDGLMISCLALVFALITSCAPLPALQKFVAAAIIGAAVAAKPPYFPLLLLFCLPQFAASETGKPYLGRALWAAIALLIAASWIMGGLIPLKVPFMADRGVSSSGQARFLMDHPLFIFHAVAETIRLEFVALAKQFVGVLGWLDTHFSANTYRFYAVFLALSVLADLAYGGNSLTPLNRVLVACAVLFATSAIFLALYLGATPVGRAWASLQGRYFIAPVLFLPAVFVPDRALLGERHWGRRLAALVPLLGAYGLWVVPRALMTRYWG